MTKKTTDILAYFSIIGWLIAYFAGTKEESKFHLNQALTIAIAEILLYILNAVFSGLLISLLLGLVGILLFVVWLIAFLGACKGEEKVAPVLGGIQILN